MRYVMLDLETMSTQPDAAIVSIGAVDNVGNEFYTNVDLRICEDMGLHIDGSTVMWWLQQSKAAQLALVEPPPIALEDALALFGDWVYGADKIWSLPASFDLTILASAYAAIGAKTPWSHRVVHCLRTAAAMCPDVPRPTYGTKHNALDDAKAQMQWLMAIKEKMGQ